MRCRLLAAASFALLAFAGLAPAAQAETCYDYRAARPIDTGFHVRRWMPPQAYVPSLAGYSGAQAVVIDRRGWTGGVGHGGAGAGGGGNAFTLAQPDSLNGPNYNSFGQSYGGDYRAAARVDGWRGQALGRK